MKLLSIFALHLTAFLHTSKSTVQPKVIALYLSVPDILDVIGPTKDQLQIFAVSDSLYPYLENFPDIIKIATVSLNRRRFLHPHVEVGPGAFKSQIINYPPNHLSSNLKKLIKLQEKYDEKQKDLNANR